MAKSVGKFEHPFFQDGVAYERERVVAIIKEWRCDDNGVKHDCLGLKGLQVEGLVAHIKGVNDEF